MLGLTATAQNILIGGKLPKDFQITIDDTGTVQFATYRRYTISAGGSVTVEYTRRGLPVQNRIDGLFEITRNGKTQKKVQSPKPPDKKDKLSKGQLLKLARAFESSTFFQMQDSYYGNAALQLATCVNHSDAKAMSITANNRTKRVYFFLGCEYGEYAPLTEFLGLYKKVEMVINGVKVKEIQTPVSQL